MSYLRIRWLHCGGFGVEGHRVQDPLSHPKATLHTSLRELHGGTCQSSKGKTYAWNLWLRSHRRIPAQLGFLQITESSGSQTAVCELGLASDVNTQVILHLLFSHSTSPKHWLLTSCFCHLYKWSYTVFSLPCLPPFTHAVFERLILSVQLIAIVSLSLLQGCSVTFVCVSLSWGWAFGLHPLRSRWDHCS